MTFTVNLYTNLVFIFEHSIFSPSIHLVLLLMRVNEILIFVYRFELFSCAVLLFLAIDWWRKNMNGKIIKFENTWQHVHSGVKIMCLRDYAHDLYTNFEISVKCCDFEYFSMVWILHLKKLWHTCNVINDNARKKVTSQYQWKVIDV